jgi:hypothetical protein
MKPGSLFRAPDGKMKMVPAGHGVPTGEPGQWHPLVQMPELLKDKPAGYVFRAPGGGLKKVPLSIADVPSTGSD